MNPIIKAKGKDFVQSFETLEECYSFEKYEEIKELIIVKLKLTKIPENLPSMLVKFDCSHNQITKIENLPSTLVDFDCRWNRITKIEILPSTLVKFN